MLLGSFKNLTYSRIRFIHKYIFKMDKAYLRKLTDTNQFQLTFHYINEDLKVNREFNFCRQLTETLDAFLTRVNTNVEKIVNKKNKKKKSTEHIESLKTSLTVNNEEVAKETVCQDIFKPENNIVLNIIDHKFQVIVNSPWIDTIALPNCILANFPVYLSKFETSFVEKELSEFIWYKSKDGKDWEEVSKDYIYYPGNGDIEHFLKIKCIPRNSETEGPAIETVSSCKVEASPGACPFEKRHMFTQSRVEDGFRVVSYNILADLYCDSDFTRTELHPYCPPYALNIDYRKLLILKEIIGYNADIICLQEVDRKVFKYDLEPFLSHLNFGCELSLKGGEVAEGLGFFYNKSKFTKLETKRFVFSEHINKDPIFEDIWEKVSQNEKLTERILARTTTLQINVLQVQGSNDILIVANVHLYFHPDADHIRLLHGGFAIRYLENFLTSLKTEDRRVSLIFCGDFNSVPECGIYKLYTTGSVPEDFVDYQSNKEEAVVGLELKQGIKLASAAGTPKYTNFTAGFADCLDYIFYDTENLSVTQVVPLPEVEELQQNTALPSITFPSDHLALVCDLNWL